jgi:hypothetical protein
LVEIDQHIASTLNEAYSRFMGLTYCDVYKHCIETARYSLSNRKTVFYEIHTATVAIQWFSKHASTINTVFSAWFVPRNYLEDKRITWRLYIEIIEAKTFKTFIRIYSY